MLPHIAHWVTTVSSTVEALRVFADWIAVVGLPKLTEHEKVKEIATRLGATTAQVLVAWGVYRGYSIIPKSVQEGKISVVSLQLQILTKFLAERIVSNFKQVELSKEDYEAVSSIGHNHHVR